jgi:hypothetical protein
MPPPAGGGTPGEFLAGCGGDPPVKKRMVITDLTRMQQGHVCICGCDKEHACVRPILLHGIPEKSLIKDGRPVIFPFALVEFDFLSPRPEPPHTEDYFYISNSPVFIQRVANPQKVLDWSVFETVEDIFEQPVLSDAGFSVMDGQGPRSVGTIRPKNIHKISYELGSESGAWDFRLNFYDNSDRYYRLKITDLTWHYYCNSLRDRFPDPDVLAKEMTRMLHDRNVYLRIGLARGWKERPDRCFLQANGIYTFPDYLEGKTFVDFYSL